MHTFAEATVNEDLSRFLADELAPLAVLGSAQDYGDALFAVVASTAPASLLCQDCGKLHLDQPAIWHRYCRNSLERFRQLLADPPTSEPQRTPVAQFAAVYRRIMELRVGDRVLDVGTNFGFLPVLLAASANVSVVACDNRHEAIAVASELATATNTSRASFVLRDVLARDFTGVGMFDTVTSVHLLEHLSDDELPAALSNMLAVTKQRLIIAVPYEENMQPLYGHQQVFTPGKLHELGSWCVQRRGGQFWCEDVEGGLLVVDSTA